MSEFWWIACENIILTFSVFAGILIELPTDLFPVSDQGFFNKYTVGEFFCLASMAAPFHWSGRSDIPLLFKKKKTPSPHPRKSLLRVLCNSHCTSATLEAAYFPPNNRFKRVCVCVCDVEIARVRTGNAVALENHWYLSLSLPLPLSLPLSLSLLAMVMLLLQNKQ